MGRLDVGDARRTPSSSGNVCSKNHPADYLGDRRARIRLLQRKRDLFICVPIFFIVSSLLVGRH